MFLDEARQLAAQCWCDPETSNIEMNTRLAEAMAHRLNLCMIDAAGYARNADFYRKILEEIGKTLQPMFPDIVRSDDGSIQDEPLILKIHEYVVCLIETVKDLRDEVELLERTLGTS